MVLKVIILGHSYITRLQGYTEIFLVNIKGVKHVIVGQLLKRRSDLFNDSI
ncbi:uncharacterized protein LOC126832452, partial [Patella vulgata]|uniref:uncharacterized protein LOC126832452 n=1 Tax=Patella vulgata TaxID=6465 RepID=UPI00217F3012